MLRHVLPCALASILFLTVAQTAQAGDLEDAVLEEINFARTQPAAYARDMLRHPAAYGGGYDDVMANQDPDAFEEAVDFLRRQRPLPPLRPDTRLTAAARDHAEAQGPSGAVGHGGRGGGPAGRMQRRGVWAGLSAENISYGYRDPRQVVQQLIIDSGVPNRGHRQNIFSGGYQAAGVACGRHRGYGSMCVIDFAGAIVQR